MRSVQYERKERERLMKRIQEQKANNKTQVIRSISISRTSNDSSNTDTYRKKSKLFRW